MTEAGLTQVSEHVYWMPPAQPYYPSLCAVVSSRQTLMLDAGADAAHAQRFLAALAAQGLPSPTYIALTHWHFDHIMGASVVAVPVIAHTDTAENITALARYDVNDAEHAQRKASGDPIASTAEMIQDQLTDPQGARVTEPSLIVHDRFELRLGGVTCQIQHVGGDHAADSCVIYVAPDRVLFLGDSLYNGFMPVSHYTAKRLYPALDTVLSFDAEHFIQGHDATMLTKAEFEAMTGKMRLSATLVRQFGADEAAIFAEFAARTGKAPDEDAEYFVRALIAGLGVE